MWYCYGCNGSTILYQLKTDGNYKCSVGGPMSQITGVGATDPCGLTAGVGGRFIMNPKSIIYVGPSMTCTMECDKTLPFGGPTSIEPKPERMVCHD